MSRRSDDLTTTSYGMLGMLAIRPWTTYELAQHMERGVSRLWPPSAQQPVQRTQEARRARRRASDE